MLHLKGITYSIGERDLLRDIDWVVPNGKRVALIGANGAGKTTLLRLISNELEAQAGFILKPKSYTIGYLPQEEIAIEHTSVLNYILKGKPEVLELDQQLHALRQKLAAGGFDATEVGARLATLEHQYEFLGGYKIESDGKAILMGLGFKVDDFARQIEEFSGGWRMRVYLARLLLQNPDLLLLDEPTNHLDLPSLEWLEDYLNTFPGSIVLVSHDRYFIDRIAKEICELRGGSLYHYAGNYHFYEEQKEKDKKLVEKKAEQLDKEKKKQQEFIERFRYKATKATQVQSRIKMLEKMEDIQLESDIKQLDFELSVDTVSYKDVLHIRDMSFRYTERWVLEDINLDIYRGQKIALVGENGAGKTTLTRLIVDQLTPQQGAVNLGHRVSVGYYAQHQVDALDLNATVYDEVSASVAIGQIPIIRNILGLFGLRGDDVYKKIGVLSGGEKARVSLTKILLSPVNFLIMDEPTNHLDIRSKEALEKALVKYNGTLILISHDRYFLDKIVHRVIELRDGRLYEFEGNYTDYLNKKRERQMVAALETNDADNLKKGLKKTREDKRREAEARQAISKRRNELQQAINKLEQNIEGMENRKEELERLIADPETYKSGELAASLNKEYRQIKEQLEERMEAWGQLQEELEKLLFELETA